MAQHWLDLTYLFASVLFVLGIKGLAHPRTAVRGNKLAALGMFVAIVVTLLSRGVLAPAYLVAGLVLGVVVGALLAIKIQITDMPQLVALFNGFGGGASILVAGAFIMHSQGQDAPVASRLLIAIFASGIIGAVTFWGSLIAFAKLQGLMTGNPVTFPGQEFANIGLLVVVLGIGGWSMDGGSPTGSYLLVTIVASLFGITLVLPVGGADMPVVVALLNSFSGVAAVAVGFVVSNSVLIISGSLVGASGLILTRIMCKAMNRSLMNVMLGMVDTSAGGGADKDIYEGRIKSTSAEEVAMLLEDARRVVVVPGYGLAVAQAQGAIRDMADILESRGVEVEYAIHPVAGRMPGHMNVLLADANISYDKLREMDDINPTLEKVDVVLVVGANDVVNPVARTDPSSPIAGMPIIDVDKARSVVVIKRSLSHGYAGIPNPLFALDNTLMLFGDAQKAILDLNNALQEN